jgi:concentrative nucleoside transporter, CNT family
MDFVNILRGLLGIAVILGIALAISNNRSRISWRTVGAGLLLQLLLAVFILRGEQMGAVFGPLGWPKAFFAWVSSFFVLVLQFTEAGTRFVFGRLGAPNQPLGPGEELGVIFAFHVLPTIIFFASLMAILYYAGVMQKVVQAMAYVVRRVLGTSGAESLSVTANVFVGQTEAPLVVRPFLSGLTHSELMAIMTGGMATIAGGVMAAYIAFLGNAFAAAQGLELQVAQQLFAERLLGASLMAAPAALLLAKIMIPETETPVTSGTANIEVESPSQNFIDAAAAGAADGLKLALNVGAMLIAFLAMIAMINYFLGIGGGVFGVADLSLELILGYLFAPLAWLIGVPWADAVQFGSFLGIKIAANEFVAYLAFADQIALATLSEKTIVMATFALCGFANFSSIAIQIGGIGPLAPERTAEIAQLGIKAVIAGTLANMMTATIAGVLVG